MSSALMSAIAERFARVREAGEWLELVVDAQLYRARIAQEPAGKVSVQVPATDGFELSLKWTDRSQPSTRAPSFDDSFLVETNDIALANTWLDRDVRDALLRRLGPADPGRLRLVVAAHRHGSGGETLTLIADDLPRAAWPPANDHRGGSLAIDGRARALLDAAKPSTTIVRPHDVEITFDGAFADADRLGAAVELAAHWSGAPTAPYR